MDRAGKYDVGLDFGSDYDPTRIGLDSYWVVAVVRLGLPLSFSRKTMSSVTRDLTQGALLRAQKPLVITDDITSINISGHKGQHKKTLSFQAIQTGTNLLVECLPGDHILAWMVNNKSDFDVLVDRIDRGLPCNDFNSGLKFVGRAVSIRKRVQKQPGTGVQTSSYNITCSGFEELDAQFYYNMSLASKDVLERDYGMWLTRIGLDVERLFGSSAKDGIEQQNMNRLIPTLLDLIVGKGPGTKGNIDVDAADGRKISATPQNQEEAPFSYMIPMMVGSLLGKGAADSGKPSYVLGYSSILELLQGVQSYNNKSGWQIFVPDLSSESTSQRRLCPEPCKGTFLPAMPDFANRPVWAVLQQYLNPTINEMYTTLRVNPEGKIVPTIVLRQIPFTTDAFQQSGSLTFDQAGPRLLGDADRSVAVTRFLSLPRWIIPNVMIQSLDVGRSDQTRVNIVNIYGSSSYQQNAIAVQEQIVQNPPVVDHLDIMRSGVRPYSATVECWVADTVGKAPSTWISLVADWTMGSQYTLNGTVECYGIQSPIAEGDNVEIDGVVFHIESVSHSGQIDANGNKGWRTVLQLTNGMRAETAGQKDYPIYPGFVDEDNTGFDPGLTLEHRATTGGKGDSTAVVDPRKKDAEATQLNPSIQTGELTPFKATDRRDL